MENEYALDAIIQLTADNLDLFESDYRARHFADRLVSEFIELGIIPANHGAVFDDLWEATIEEED